MTTELERPAQSALAVSNGQDYWNDKQLAALAQIGVQDASKADLAVLLNYSQKTGLDPFTRQLYMIKRQGKWTIQTSIDGFRIIADRVCERRGVMRSEEDVVWYDADGKAHTEWLSKAAPAAARYTCLIVGPAGASRFSAVARFDEYSAGGGMWTKMPALMIAKCAEALALRKAFPHDLSGLYTSDEMGAQEQPQTRPAQPQPAPATVHVLPKHDTETGEILDGEIVEADVLSFPGTAQELQARLGDKFEVLERPSTPRHGEALVSERQAKMLLAIGHNLSLHTTAALCEALSAFLGRRIDTVDQVSVAEAPRILDDKGDALLAFLGGNLPADQSPDDPWANTPPASDLATKPQLAKLGAAFSAVGITDKTERRDYCIAVINRPIDSSADMTKKEASTVIDALTKDN